MPTPPPDVCFEARVPKTLAALLREKLPERSWSEVRGLCQRGKVSVDGVVVIDPAARPRPGQHIVLRLRAPILRKPLPPGFRIVFEDGHLVVIDKPEGVSSVPYERKESGTALDLVREAWRHEGRQATVTPLYVVHRIDKDTSGLLCFAKTRLAERGLHRVFQNHLADREYLACAHGQAKSQRIESHLVEDRGDGLRGSARDAAQGRRAVTHVQAVEPLAAATVCRVRLETGRTHQIRIHLAERGHPLVGESVYIRDFRGSGGALIPASRLMLHATTLGFAHPVAGRPLAFESPPPVDFQHVLERLRIGIRP